MRLEPLYTEKTTWNITSLRSTTRTVSDARHLLPLIDRRNNYRSHRIIDDLLEVLAEVIKEPIVTKIKSSQGINETTVGRQLDLHVRSIDKEGKEGLVFNHFLDLIPFADGKADTIVAAVKNDILKKGLPTEKLYGLGTDGAAVMTGRVNGVAKQLKDSFPKIVLPTDWPLPARTHQMM